MPRSASCCINLSPWGTRVNHGQLDAPSDQGLTRNTPGGSPLGSRMIQWIPLFKANPTLLLLDRRFWWNLKFVFKFEVLKIKLKLFLCNSSLAGLSHGQGLGPWAMFVNAISTPALALKGQVRTERFWVSPTRMPFANLAKTSHWLTVL